MIAPRLVAGSPPPERMSLRAFRRAQRQFLLPMEPAEVRVWADRLRKARRGGTAGLPLGPIDPNGLVVEHADYTRSALLIDLEDDARILDTFESYSASKHALLVAPSFYRDFLAVYGRHPYELTEPGTTAAEADRPIQESPWSRLAGSLVRGTWFHYAKQRGYDLAWIGNEVRLLASLRASVVRAYPSGAWMVSHYSLVRDAKDTASAEALAAFGFKDTTLDEIERAAEILKTATVAFERIDGLGYVERGEAQDAELDVLWLAAARTVLRAAGMALVGAGGESAGPIGVKILYMADHTPRLAQLLGHVPPTALPARWSEDGFLLAQLRAAAGTQHSEVRRRRPIFIASCDKFAASMQAVLTDRMPGPDLILLDPSLVRDLRIDAERAATQCIDLVYPLCPPLGRWMSQIPHVTLI